MTLFDLFIIVIIALSGLFAWVRGLTREFVTLVAIGLGAGACLLFGQGFSSLFGDGTLMLIAGYAVLFLVIFLLSSIALELLLGKFLGRDPAQWDQIAGAVYGVIRGWLLLGLAYLALNIYFDETDPPEWLEQSGLKGLIAVSAGLFEQFGLEPGATDPDTENTESGQTEPV